MDGAEPWVLTSGTDAAGEHEVKLLGLSDLVVGIWIGDLVFATQFTELWA